MSTVFVFVTDEKYYNRFKRTVIDLRNCGD